MKQSLKPIGRAQKCCSARKRDKSDADVLCTVRRGDFGEADEAMRIFQHGLHIVPTPIGNMSDMTLRAIETLKNVDLIATEDTRHSKKLLGEYDIKTPTISFHAGSDPQKIVEILKQGKSIALISDAGTPCISDPGSRLVSATRAAGFKISPLPGASAIITALSASGFPTNRFEFFGFLPHKKGRQTLLKEIEELNHTAVFYESTHRIMKFLEQATAIFAPERKVCLARELTKIYEEFLIDSPADLQALLKKTPEKQKGEFTVIVAPKEF